MGLFQPYQRAEKQASEPEAVEAPADTSGKKKIATPTRREAEQARRERLRPVLTKKQAREREREARMAVGEEQRRAADAQPGRQLARDFVDSRRSLLQFTMPIIMTALICYVVGGAISETVVLWTAIATWVIFGGLIVGIANIVIRFGRLHRERLPHESIRGLRFYVANRAINPRRMRIPQPRVNIGDKI